MNNFIENVSLYDVRNGLHADGGPNCILIQITDLLTDPPTPLKEFREIHHFRFEDIEEDEEWAISDDQASEIAQILTRAKDQGSNVIVHCHAGICRSGAVVECGIALGFNPPDRVRLPNVLVKKKIMKALGLWIDERTSVFEEEFYNRSFD